MTPKLHLILLKNTPIFEQLQIEEALLRTEEKSFCIINIGSPRAIVMGISGQAEALLDADAVKKEEVPVIRRYSGGGTVVVDPDTLFVTFILSKDLLGLPPFPEPILRWSAEFYASAWKIPHFQLRENDYCIGNLKCGGNAQYIKKERWSHHTSFLWDFHESNMNLLLMPAKQPKYREKRSHSDFLCRLNSHAASPQELIKKIEAELVKRFYMETFDLHSWERRPHRQATYFIKM